MKKGLALFMFYIVLVLLGFNKCYAQKYTYNIITDSSLGKLYDMYSYKNEEYILISGDSSFTKISKFNITNNSIETIEVLEINCKYCCFKENKLYILADSEEENNTSIGESKIYTNVYVYDFKNETLISEIVLMNKIESKEKFCIDNNGEIYYIYNNNNVKSVSCEGGEEKTIYSGNPVSCISFNAKEGILYILSDYYSNITCYDVNNDKIICDTKGECPNGKITFLNDNEIVDSLNNLYEISSDGTSFTKRFQFIPRGNLNNICEIEDKVLSYNGTDTFYVFNNSTYNLLGKINIDNNILCAPAGSSLLSVCESEQGYIYYVIDVSAYEKTAGNVITNQDNLFDFYPESGIYDGIVIDENYFWKLVLKDGLMVDDYSELKVNILEVNSGKSEELTINNRLSVDGNSIKMFPSNICYDNLLSYKLIISGICNNIGEPCIIEHSLEIYYKISDMCEYYISSDVYNIDYENKLITGVEPQTSISAFKKNFNVKGYSIIILDKTGNSNSSGNISTGKSINFIRDGKIVYKFKIIIYGDVNGSGNVSSRDLYILRNYLLGNSKISDEFLIAADINHDSKVDTLDLLCLSKYLSGEYNIIQKVTEVNINGVSCEIL